MEIAPALAAPGGTIARPALPLADEIAEHLREELGSVRIGGVSRDRLDLIAEQCDTDTRRAVIAWLTTGKRRSRNTRRAYADDVRFWAGFAAELGMPALSLAALTSAHVTVWRVAQESRGASNRSMARRLSSLSSLYNHAARHGLNVANPVDPEDHRPAIDRHDRASATPVLEIADIRAMVEAASDARDALVVTLLYTLAGRVSEMCAADVTDLTDTGRRAELQVTRKGGKRRALALPPAVADLLAAHVGRRTSGPLLLDAAGERLDRHDVDRMLTRLGRRAKVNGGRAVTPHVLRASRITHMVDAGVPLAEVQAYADHADPSTTIGYVERRHADSRNQRLASDAVDLLGDVLDRWVPRH
jgi:site-specific recombinase XerD